MNSNKTTLFSLLIIIMLSIAGCSISPTEKKYNTATDTLTIDSLGDSNSNFKLGIAISGGGLRSATYSFGVLKSLYDAGILQDVDIVSTVSGGGYTGYELFINELNATSSDGFGSATFSDENFNRRLYHHYYTANFVSNWQLAKAIFTNNTFISVYKTQIERKYGYNDANSSKISKLAALRKSKKIPEFVINTTVRNLKPLRYGADMYEFTPYLAGSIERGFHPYKKNKSPELSNLTAISGAAIDSVFGKTILEQTISDPTTLSSDRLTLSDGGHSENLGAFTLIRRGVKHIIIIDAEHDPNYEFKGYVDLKKRLEHWGTELNVTNIDNLLKPEKDKHRAELSRGERVLTPLMTGIAINKDGSESIISYLKMINSTFVDERICNDKSLKGAKEIRRVRKILDKNKDSNCKWTSKALDDVQIDHKAVFAYHLDSYPKFLQSLRKARLINSLDVDLLTLSFPQYSTGDQSYYNDQFMAWVSLGYFSAQSIKKQQYNKY